MPQRPKVGVGVIITKNSTVLLMKRQNAHGDGTWSTPGGHLEYGESFEACAIRETYEETGLVVASPIFRAITNDVFVEEEKHYITVWIEAIYVSGEATIHSPREMTDVGWFAWNALPEPLFLPLKQLVSNQAYPSGIVRAAMDRPYTIH
ncbi:MAG: NUDIX hydrolase [Ktedonobacteraceae bacterium]